MATWQVVIVFVIGISIAIELSQITGFLREIRDTMISLSVESEEITKMLGIIQSDTNVIKVFIKKQGQDPASTFG